jgi:hypothetical protein
MPWLAAGLGFLVGILATAKAGRAAAEAPETRQKASAA